MNVLHLLPHHAADLAGRSSRNLERLKILEGAVIDVNVAASSVTIIADDASIVKVTVSSFNMCACV